MPKKAAATFSKVDLTWAYPLLERGVALSSDGGQLAQFERTDQPDHAWRCTRAYALEPFEAFDLLALWLFDGCLSWIAQLIRLESSSPESSDVPHYLVHVNNRGVVRVSRPQLRHARWVEVADLRAAQHRTFISTDAQDAEIAGWSALDG